EDGIRDRTVTGVQTCALPISFVITQDDIGGDVKIDRARRKFHGGELHGQEAAMAAERKHFFGVADGVDVVAVGDGPEGGVTAGRSEERRVGKGCRWWGWRERG